MHFYIFLTSRKTNQNFVSVGVTVKTDSNYFPFSASSNCRNLTSPFGILKFVTHFEFESVFLIYVQFVALYQSLLFDTKRVNLHCSFFCNSACLHLVEYCPFCILYLFCICFITFYFGMLWPISVLPSLFYSLWH